MHLEIKSIENGYLVKHVVKEETEDTSEYSEIYAFLSWKALVAWIEDTFDKEIIYE
jgi:hypothetical protein